MKKLFYLMFTFSLVFACGDNSSESDDQSKDSDATYISPESAQGKYIWEDSRFQLIMILNEDELSFMEKSATRKRGFTATYHINNEQLIILDQIIDGPEKVADKWNNCGIKINEEGIEFWEDFSRKDKRLLFTKIESNEETPINFEESQEENEIDTKAKKSIYDKYFDDISEGKKLLCFFSPTCEHCMETGKQITVLSKKYPGLIPEVRILFMDESDNGSEKEIKDYFNFIAKEYTYKVLSIEDFVPLFWGEKDFPGVMYLYEGKEQIFFDGNGENEFNTSKLLQEIKREY